jgi:hypothetical protein
MSALFSYIGYWWSSPEDQNGVEADKSTNIIPKSFTDKKPLSLISQSDLIKVKLNPPKDIIPAPARNMPPVDKFTLNVLNQAQLKQIMSVKLKKTKHKEKVIYYEPRHPVLKELLQKNSKK